MAARRDNLFIIKGGLLKTYLGTPGLYNSRCLPFMRPHPPWNGFGPPLHRSYKMAALDVWISISKGSGCSGEDNVTYIMRGIIVSLLIDCLNVSSLVGGKQ